MHVVCVQSSFARYMSSQGFDTWTLEVRGAGLSTLADNLEEDEEFLKNLSRMDSSINGDKSSASFESEVTQINKRGSEVVTKYEELRITARLTEIFTRMSDRLSGFLELQDRLAGFLELQDRLTAPLEEFQKQLELFVKYDWDFDHYLEEDVPAAVR